MYGADGPRNMESISQKHSSEATREVANVGWARPPLVYGTAIATGFLLELARPLPFLPRTFAALLGSFLVVVAVWVFLYSMRKFRMAGTPVPGNAPTTAIVRTGPYRFSRNPIYLAFSIFQLGIASWVNSVWLLGTLIPAVAIMAFVVIPREERYLERKFGADYRDYKRSVRRWL
jgi:protein-S-isoprenylcysteine O-methyltransferase Ste14